MAPSIHPTNVVKLFRWLFSVACSTFLRSSSFVLKTKTSRPPIAVDSIESHFEFRLQVFSFNGPLLHFRLIFMSNRRTCCTLRAQHVVNSVCSNQLFLVFYVHNFIRFISFQIICIRYLIKICHFHANIESPCVQS